MMIRSYREDDRRYVFSTWLLSTRDHLKHITWEQRRAVVGALIEACDISVMCVDDDVILGWVAKLGDVTMWVYVQKDARGCGIRRSLEKD
jgi:hypothetical protein